jgi:hypothetical protein
VAVPLLLGLVVVFVLEATVDVLEVLVPGAGALLAGGVVFATDVVATGVFAAAVVELEAATVSDVRSIKLVFGATKLGMELEVDAVSEPLDSPSAPHAARPNVSRLHNTTLRI